jgi:hypothetical protein
MTWGSTGAKPRSGRVNTSCPSHRMDKNNYYHSFKTRFDNLLKARFMLRAGRVSLGDPIFIFLKIKTTLF